MKNSTLMKFLECLYIRDYSQPVEENGFKMDFSSVNYSQNLTSSIEKKSENWTSQSFASGFICLSVSLCVW